MRYAGWGYGDCFVDLSSGSKAGNLYRRFEVPSLDFEYSGKRPGQEGGLIRTTVILTDRLKMTGSVLYAQFNRDTSNTDLSIALMNQLSQEWMIQLDYLDGRNRRLGCTGDGVRDDRRTRLEGRYISGQWRLRTYIAYNSGDARDDCLSLFCSAQWETRDIGRLEVWSNLARLDKDGPAYWYVFVRNELDLMEGFSMAAKIGSAYDREAGTKHRTTVSIELAASL